MKNRFLCGMAFIAMLSGCNFSDQSKLLNTPKKVETSRSLSDGHFDWTFRDKPKGRTIIFGSDIKEKKLIGSFFEIRYESKLPEVLSKAERLLFVKTIVTENGVPKNIYIYKYPSKAIERERKSESKDKVRLKVLKKIENARERKIEKADPQSLTLQECAFLIRQKKILFLTGAGMSIAAGIPTFPELFKDLGFVFTEMVDDMVKVALKDPQRISSVVSKFHQSFCEASPTTAHFALAKLAEYKGVQIVTGNVDLLHQRAGIEPYLIGAPHVDFDIEKDLTELVAKKIDAIFCIGSSFDFRGFIGRYKKLNPQGLIIAINKEKPKYIGDEDFFVSGDSQEIVPDLADLVMDTDKAKNIEKK